MRAYRATNSRVMIKAGVTGVAWRARRSGHSYGRRPLPLGLGNRVVQTRSKLVEVEALAG